MDKNIKELNPVDRALEPIKEEERQARRGVLNYYKKKAPFHFLAIIGGWTILVIILWYFIEDPHMGVEGGICWGILIYGASFIYQFTKDIKNPEEFSE